MDENKISDNADENDIPSTPRRKPGNGRAARAGNGMPPRVPKRGSKPAPPSALRLRGTQPVIFVNLEGELRLEFESVRPGEMALVMRAMAPDLPGSLDAEVVYHAGRGTEVGRAALELAPNHQRALSFLPQEDGIGHIADGKPYRLSGALNVPPSARGCVVTIKPTDWSRHLFPLLQSARLQPRHVSPLDGYASYASDAFLRLPHHDKRARIVFKFRPPAAHTARFAQLTLSDVIGTGAAICRLRHFDANGEQVVLDENDARGRDFATLYVLPRVRKLESPGRTDRVFSIARCSPVTAELSVGMIEDGEHGYLSVLSTAMSYRLNLPTERTRAGLNAIASEFYRDAEAKSVDELIRLRL